MAYYVIDNFAAGTDLRRSKEVASPGTLRRLINGFINEGGEIEKRKAFAMVDEVTSYAQTVARKARVTGPHPIPGDTTAVFFRHHANNLPNAPFVNGAGTLAAYVDYGSGNQALRFWAMKTAATPPSFGALLHAASYSEFANSGHLFLGWIKAPTRENGREHVEITFTNSEPTAEAIIVANADRAFQISLGQRGYVADGNDIYLSAVNDPADMAGVGSGVLSITKNGQPVGGILSLGDYFGQLAIFGRRGVQFYTVDPDPARLQYLRTLQAWPLAPRSVTGYASGDIIYLGSSGIRSLQARDSSNLAAVNDVGSPIDRLLREALVYDEEDAEPIFSAGYPALPLGEFHNLAQGAVHPRDGSFWLFLREKAYVFSRHPGARVAAWSVFDLPVPDPDHTSDRNGQIKGRWCADVCQIGDTLTFRNFADEVFVYGGETGDQYDDSIVEVVTPYIDMGKPGHRKHFTGIDLVCEGLWTVEASTVVNSDHTDAPWTKVCDADGRTRTAYRVQMNNHGTQIALRLTSRDRSAARLAQIVIHYEDGEKK